MSNVALTNNPTRPRLGMTVIYTDHSGDEYVAVTIGVHTDDTLPSGAAADLHCMGLGGCFSIPAALMGVGPGTWRWPS